MSEQSNETPQPSEPEVTLGHLSRDISFVTRALRAHLGRENAGFFQAHDAAGGQVALICLIGLNPGISQKELAQAVVLKKSALTKQMNDLEVKGLIERRKGGTDLRVNALHLTAAGQKRWQAMTRDMLALQDRLLAPLTSAEREILFEFLWRVLDGLGPIDPQD